jgi:integrase
VDALAETYLEWVARHRAAKSLSVQRGHLKRFRDAYGTRPALSITADDLEAFQADLARAYPPVYVRKHSVTVRSMVHLAARRGWLPPGFDPFRTAEHVKVGPRPLLESDLPTPGEVAALEAECVPCMLDILRCYHATGARTSELIDARVRDYQAGIQALVLGRHKREKTLKDPLPRTVQLNAEAARIIGRLCGGRRPDDPIFRREDGRAWTLEALNHRVKAATVRAGLREGITPYSFRHLWISEALMAGLDIALVARMAGTSVAMIEKVYGHFRGQALAEAQARVDRYRRQLATPESPEDPNPDSEPKSYRRKG